MHLWRISNLACCALASRDSKSFRSTAAALDEKARELEALIANTTDDFHKKEDECLICALLNLSL